MDVVPLDRIAGRSRLVAVAGLGAAVVALTIAAVQTWGARDEGDVRERVVGLEAQVQVLGVDLAAVRADGVRERAAADAALRASQIALERTRLEADMLRDELVDHRR